MLKPLIVDYNGAPNFKAWRGDLVESETYATDGHILVRLDRIHPKYAKRLQKTPKDGVQHPEDRIEKYWDDWTARLKPAVIAGSYPVAPSAGTENRSALIYVTADAVPTPDSEFTLLDPARAAFLLQLLGQEPRVSINHLDMAGFSTRDAEGAWQMAAILAPLGKADAPSMEEVLAIPEYDSIPTLNTLEFEHAAFDRPACNQTLIDMMGAAGVDLVKVGEWVLERRHTPNPMQADVIRGAMVESGVAAAVIEQVLDRTMAIAGRRTELICWDSEAQCRLARF